MNHPHPDKKHVMVSIRRSFLGMRRLHQADDRNPRPRSLIHYRDLLATYREAKRLVLADAERTQVEAGRWSEAKKKEQAINRARRATSKLVDPTPYHSVAVPHGFNRF
jgi:hypothetical protein